MYWAAWYLWKWWWNKKKLTFFFVSSLVNDDIDCEINSEIFSIVQILTSWKRFILVEIITFSCSQLSSYSTRYSIVACYSFISKMLQKNKEISCESDSVNKKFLKLTCVVVFFFLTISNLLFFMSHHQLRLLNMNLCWNMRTFCEPTNCAFETKTFI